MPVLEEEPAQKESSRPKHPDLLVDLDEHAQAGTKTPLFHRRGVIIGGAALALLAIVYVATIFFHSLTHESTDDAFIDAHIVSIAPKIAGRISAVKVRDNQLVKQGDLLIEIDPHDIEASVPQKQAAARRSEGALRERAALGGTSVRACRNGAGGVRFRGGDD